MRNVASVGINTFNTFGWSISIFQVKMRHFRSSEQLLGLLTLPSSIGGGNCDGHSEDPVRYMEDGTDECRRSLEGVADCSREGWLDAASYLTGFREEAIDGIKPGLFSIRI